MYNFTDLSICGTNDARYVVSTGGDYDSALGKSVPGFSIYHFGLDLVAVVSTGEDVWELKVNDK